MEQTALGRAKIALRMARGILWAAFVRCVGVIRLTF